MAKKLSNDIIDLRLKGTGIRRGEDYPGNKETLMKWICEICNLDWPARAGNVAPLNRKGTGCPHCAGNFPHTNSSFDKFLIDNNIPIVRIGNIKGMQNLTEFKCKNYTCNYEWFSTPDNIKRGNRCRKCSNKLLLCNEYMDNWIISNDVPLIRLSDIKGAHELTNWGCLNIECNNTWPATPNSIRAFKGCPLCNKIGKNEKIILTYLKDNCIKHIHQFKIVNNYSDRKYFEIDFFIIQDNFFIEYNGVQHYEPRCFGGISIERANDNFLKQCKRDEYVRSYCKENNIILVEIDGRKYTNNKLIEYLNTLFNMKENK